MGQKLIYSKHQLVNLIIVYFRVTIIMVKCIDFLFVYFYDTEYKLLEIKILD